MPKKAMTKEELKKVSGGLREKDNKPQIFISDSAINCDGHLRFDGAEDIKMGMDSQRGMAKTKDTPWLRFLEGIKKLFF